MKRIFMVDDHPIMRLGLSQLIESEEDLEICGEANNAKEAMEFFEHHEADLAILDIALPDKDGVELLKDLLAQHEGLATLVVSMHDENLYAERVLRAGARGYVMKQEAPENLIKAIRMALSGGVFVSPNIAARIVQNFAASGGAPSSPVGRLTDRELEVFRLIGQGYGSREIAGKLNISSRTVDAHRAHIKEKLGLRDATELMHRAVNWVATGKIE